MSDRRAIIVGSGPNGLASGIILASSGIDVHICEKEPTFGGGLRSSVP